MPDDAPAPTVPTAPAAHAGTGAAAVRQVHGACPHDCPDTCALDLRVQGDKAIAVHGAADHRHTRGVLCTKVSRYAERVEHPERLLQPMKRVGPKGSSAPEAFVPIGWDEALATVAARLSAIAARDPQAILPYSYAGTMGLLQGEAMAGRFFHRLGASRLDRTICASAGGAGLLATYGGKFGLRIEHFAQARLILIWGSNSIASNLHFWALAQEAKRAGARLVCIDPRRSETAEKCHQHIALLPGTDGALALGLMHELVVHGWIDEDFVTRHVEQAEHDEHGGWPALREEALAWPPERTAATCGITADEVRDLARALGNTTPAAIRLNYGMQRARGGGNAVRLIALLPCLTGAWRQRGGGLLLSASGWANLHVDHAALQRPELLAGRTPRTLNMSTIGADLLRPASATFGPRIEALVVYNANPVAVAPQSPEVVAGFGREDLFTVVLEQFRTDTADYADILLPATTQFEHLDLHTSYGHTDVLVNEPAVPARGQARPNTQIFRGLAAAMGFDEPCFADDDEALLAQALKPSAGIDLVALRARGWASLPVPEAPFADGRFATPSGRARVGVPGLGLPAYVPPYESPASAPGLAARYPLAMISPPARHFLNSTFVNVRSLRSIEGEPLLEMHPADAAARGIADGDRVAVFNDRGRYRCTARVGDAAHPRARPGVVNGLGIWWRKLGLDGRNVNELTHQQLTDLGAAPCFYDVLVQVERDVEASTSPAAARPAA